MLMELANRMPASSIVSPDPNRDGTNIVVASGRVVDYEILATFRPDQSRSEVMRILGGICDYEIEAIQRHQALVEQGSRESFNLDAEPGIRLWHESTQGSRQTLLLDLKFGPDLAETASMVANVVRLACDVTSQRSPALSAQ